VQLEVDGVGAQPGRLWVGLTEQAEGGVAKVVGVLLEVGAGGCPWNRTGEVLEPPLQGFRHDDPFVLGGEWAGQSAELLQLSLDLQSLAGEEVVHELVGADGGACHDQALASMSDAEFGCCCCCDIAVRAVRCALGGHGGEAYGTHLRGEDFECECSCGGGADYVDVVKVRNDLRRRACRGRALEGALERDGEKQGSEGVPLLHPAG
jgi:hypothetical protein